MKKIFLSLILLITLGMPSVVSAQGVSNPVDPFDDVCKRANVNSSSTPSACKDKNLNGGNPVYGPDGIIAKVVNMISIVVGIAAVISIILAGARLITSASNPEEVTKSREYIQYAIIGLLVAATAQAMVRLVLFRIGVT